MKIVHCADLHLRRSVPPCRTETEQEWLELQKSSLLKLKELAVQEDAYLFIVGDIFDSAVASVQVVNMFLETFLPISERVVIMAGNHDLPQHNINAKDESSYGILAKYFSEIDNIPLLNKEGIGGHHFKTEYTGNYKIACTHQFVTMSTEKVDLYGTGITATNLTAQFPDAEIILCGDNHHCFMSKTETAIVLNPGCMTRQTVAFSDYEPICFIIDTDSKKIRAEKLPDCEAVLSEEHLVYTRNKEERVDRVVSLVRNKQSTTLDFISNLVLAAEKAGGKVKDEVENIIKTIKGKNEVR